MAIVIDGITLPALPETGFKYEAVVRLIIYWGSTPTTQFIYLASNTEMIRIPSSLIDEEGTMQEDLSMLSTSDFSGVSYMYVVEGETQDWAEHESNGFMQMLGTYELKDSSLDMTQVSNLEWSNHDIKTVTAINPDTMEITVGNEIYWYAGYAADQHREPEYGKIRRAIIRGASNAVRRKTGRTDKFPPEQLEYEIDSIVTADGIPNAGDSAYSFGAVKATNLFTTINQNYVESSNAMLGYEFKVKEAMVVHGFSVACLSNADTQMMVALWDGDNQTKITEALFVQTLKYPEWETIPIGVPVTLDPQKKYCVTLRPKTKGKYWSAKLPSGDISTTVSDVISEIHGVWNSSDWTSDSDSYPLNDNGTNYCAANIALIPVSESEEHDIYLLATTTLNIFAEEVQRIVGTNAKMSVSEMISALQSVATATAEE